MIRCSDLPLSELDNHLLDTQVKCVYMHLAHSKDRWECTSHTHDRLEIGYIYRGSGSYQIGEELFCANPGDIFVVPKSVPHYEVHNPEAPFEIIFLMMEFLGKQGEWTERILESLQGKIELAIPERLKQIYDNIIDEVVYQEAGYLSAIDANLKMLILLLFRQTVEKAAKSQNDVSTLRSQAVVESVKAYIEECIQEGRGEQLNLDSLAKRFFYHPKYLNHIFKMKTGATIGEYLTDHKIEYARNALSQSSMSIDSLWKTLGFCNIQHFYRLFKKKTGYTPAGYRDHYRCAPKESF